MILELILLALILFIVYVLYKVAMMVYREQDHPFGVWFNFKHYTFPDLDQLREDLQVGAISSQYHHAHYSSYGLKDNWTMANFPTIDDPIMRKAFNIISNQMGGMDRTERAEFLLAFIQQNFRYVKDQESTGYSDYWKFPINTFEDRFGDCEDMAFLLANLYYHAGLDVVTVWVTGHMTVGVCLPSVKSYNVFELEGRHYAQAEPTAMCGIGDYHKKYDKVYYVVKPVCPDVDFWKMMIKERN